MSSIAKEHHYSVCQSLPASFEGGMERSDTEQQKFFYCIHLSCLGLVTKEHFYTSNFLYG